MAKCLSKRFSHCLFRRSSFKRNNRHGFKFDGSEPNMEWAVDSSHVSTLNCALRNSHWNCIYKTSESEVIE